MITAVARITLINPRRTCIPQQMSQLTTVIGFIGRQPMWMIRLALPTLYHDDDNSGFNGTLITDSLLEGTHSNYEWDTSALDERDYYLYAIIDDGFNPPDYQYAAARFTIDFTIQHPLSDTGKYWGGNYSSGNNADCSGETISRSRTAVMAVMLRPMPARLTKIGGGAVGFDFTRLNADGSEYTGEQQLS